MCGITGIAWTDDRPGDVIDCALAASIEAMRYRGPDSSGTVMWQPGEGAGAALGSARLAVLDRSAAGQQPMSTPDGRFTLVYNGEITNYVELREQLSREGVIFASSSDTEVVLRAWERWGVEATDRFEGMFAVAVIDRAAGTLTLARDVFGIKPLFYALTPGALAFGSEIGCLLHLVDGRPRLNWRTAVAYLASGTYDEGEDTFVEGISHLQPGAHLVRHVISGATEVVPPRWRPSISTDTTLTRGQAAELVREQFLTSVRRNLRSDVPVGVALSGGIDSSAIACAVRALEPDLPLQTFSYVPTGTHVDESRWIDEVVAATGAQPHSVTPVAGDLTRDIDRVISAQGEPFASTSIYAQYRVFELMHDSGIVVSLDGQGADELFAGYRTFAGARARSLVEVGRPGEALRFLRGWGRAPGASLAAGLVRTGLEFAPRPLADAALRRRPGGMPPGLRPQVLRDRGIPWRRPHGALQTEGLRGVRLKASLRESLLHGGLQALLRHGDRNSMHFSVESRVPFLDRSLATTVLSLPEDMLMDGQGTTKSILRRALRGLVPESVLARRDKIGFETPETAWLSEHRSFLAEAVRSAPPIGFLDSAEVAAGIESGGVSGRQVPVGLTWRLFNLYRWASLMDVDCA